MDEFIKWLKKYVWSGVGGLALSVAGLVWGLMTDATPFLLGMWALALFPIGVTCALVVYAIGPSLVQRTRAAQPKMRLAIELALVAIVVLLASEWIRLNQRPTKEKADEMADDRAAAPRESVVALLDTVGSLRSLGASLLQENSEFRRKADTKAIRAQATSLQREGRALLKRCCDSITSADSALMADLGAWRRSVRTFLLPYNPGFVSEAHKDQPGDPAAKVFGLCRNGFMNAQMWEIERDLEELRLIGIME